MFLPAGAYADWTVWLDAFAAGRTPPDAHLVPLSEELGPYVQQRVAERVADAVRVRTGLWNRRLQADLDRASSIGEVALQAALVNGREQLRPILQVCNWRLLPADLRSQLLEWASDAVRSVQTDLESSARRLPNASQRILTVVRTASLLGVLQQVSEAGPGGSDTSALSGPPPQPSAPLERQRARRVIL